jgi:cation diffusion facilitator CzcD-associated flavoprotein CzcO
MTTVLSLPSVIRNSDQGRTIVNEHFDTAIIGGGQAGLAAAYYVKQKGRIPVVLDENERVGDSWRKRWDSLRLFTQSKYDGLPGWRFPAPRTSCPTKDEMADYMEAYAARFDLDVRTGVKIDRLSKQDGSFTITAGPKTFEADNVIVATGSHRVPQVPDFARDLDPRILQLHSSEYRSPAQLREGPVLIVGLGNSGAEIGIELSTRLRRVALLLALRTDKEHADRTQARPESDHPRPAHPHQDEASDRGRRRPRRPCRRTAKRPAASG